MYAIIETGGRQVVASPGEVVRLQTVDGDDGDSVDFGAVVAVSDDNGKMLTGDDLKDAKVTGVIADHGRGKKVIVFKFKRRKMYRRRQGHRQNYTDVKIDQIVV
jgi:large subunit ribosomal protein L21